MTVVDFLVLLVLLLEVSPVLTSRLRDTYSPQYHKNLDKVGALQQSASVSAF